MVEAARIRSLEGRMYSTNGVMLSPVEACDRISLRAEEKALSALGKALGVSLPRKPGTSETKNEFSALWIGPDEWFVIGPDNAGLEGKVARVRAGLFSAVSINNRNTGIVVAGPNAELALNSGCPQDLSIDAFPVGACARTIIGKAEVILWRTSEARFHVECWRSFSDYVWKYLVASARTA